MANDGQSSKKKRGDEEYPQELDSGQKPLQLQRRRVWRACESCRRKKIKCDGTEPTCSQCAASGSQCTWLQTKDRAALSRHYVQELESRLLHMESLFSQIAPVLDQFGPLPNPTPSNGLSSPVSGPSGSESAPAAMQSRSLPPKDRSPSVPIKAEEDDVSESFGQLALDEYGHMRWIGGSSTMSLIQSFKALTTSSVHRRSPMEEDPMAPGPSVNKLYFPAAVFFGKTKSALPGAEQVEYPPRDLADKLVGAYFSRLHFLNPVIDKPSFLRKYNFLIENTHDHSFARAETPFLALVFAVFACAARLVEDDRLTTGDSQDDGGMGMVYYERALILQYISHADIQVDHVQCFLLLSTFLCAVNCLPQAWILVGQAVRTGQDLGLHRSPRRLTITPIEKETRRKVWWGVYALDRMLALALGRPLGVNDFDCDVEYPVEIDDEYLPDYFNGVITPQRQPALLAGFINLVSLYKIGGKVLREVYALEVCRDNLEPDRKAELQKTVENLDAELTQWCEDLPDMFKSQSETDQQVSMGAVLCSHYYSVLTTLHRNLLPVKRDQPVTAKSTVKAVSSARSCIRLAPSIKNVVPACHHLAFFIQHLFSSAVILLLYAMHSSEPRAAAAAMDEAKSTLGALESWEGHWPGARKCKELLMELTTTAADAVAKQQVAELSDSFPGRERRRSVTIAAGSSSRISKSKRRNQSRDPGTTSNRRLAAVSPYRVDSAQRARSTSRRRGLDDDSKDRRSSMYQSFASPASAQSASPHSSPPSVTVPSPVPALESSSPQPSPTLAANTAYGYNPNSFDFEYGMNPLSHNGNGQQPWNGSSNGDSQGAELYPQYNNSYAPYSDLDSFSFAGQATDPGLAELSSAFAPGLPFRGLEYIRNYGNGSGSVAGGYPVGEQDSLWKSYDPNAFEYNPDLPFTFHGDAMTTDEAH
ncbi:unnamed protein product [Mycena citricolor]|uniref:Zn(2)-C6 fungal-type domain-containing protein n=1 Tax=Mycena citricolor TaxID=2018698 RepID=A0AAD2K2U1_9AGAR|nr:unnamed protein product [Mycena citricolor]